jgi:ATP-binding cassette, subfamily B, bacterial
MISGCMFPSLPEEMTWPAAAADDALAALASRLGLSVHRLTAHESSTAEPDLLSARLAAQAERLGLEIEPVETSYREAAKTLRVCAPALLVLPEGRLLAIAGGRGSRLRVLPPQGRPRWIRLPEVAGRWLAPWETEAGPAVDHLVEAAGVAGRRQPRAREALLAERLARRRLTGIFLVRLPPGSSFWRQARWAGLHRSFLGFVGFYFVSYALFLASWWALGAGVLGGHFVRDGILAWGLILASVVPFRAMNTWFMAKLTIDGGALLKRRLLAGALKLQPEEIRDQGVGRLLGRVLESEAVETLALNGGFLTIVGLIEIVLSAGILAAAGGRQVALLGVWMLVSLAMGRRLYRERRAWTDRRLEMTHDLVERLVGYRTRIAQEPRDRWHEEEDRLLARYLEDSRRFDRAKAVMVSAVPRGWLAVGWLGLLPVFLAGGGSRTLLALSVGGMLAAYRGLLKLAEGFSHLSGAILGWRQAEELFHAAARREASACVSLPEAPPQDAPGAVLEAVDLAFRHRRRSRAVLDGCDLRVEPGDRILLEGASGCGKSTLAAVLAGLREPDSGLVLLHGLDRHSLGGEAWRRRVALAPQFHENHVFTETFAFNLLMGRDWPPTPEDLDEALGVCRELGLGDLLARMPSGLQQIVGESGWQLSHGERSRLYMARALLQRAGVVVLDESFAALDPENLQQALDCVLRRAPSLLVIAHP